MYNIDQENFHFNAFAFVKNKYFKLNCMLTENFVSFLVQKTASSVSETMQKSNKALRIKNVFKILNSVNVERINIEIKECISESMIFLICYA